MQTSLTNVNPICHQSHWPAIDDTSTHATNIIKALPIAEKVEIAVERLIANKVIYFSDDQVHAQSPFSLEFLDNVKDRLENLGLKYDKYEVIDKGDSIWGSNTIGYLDGVKLWIVQNGANDS